MKWGKKGAIPVVSLFSGMEYGVHVVVIDYD
jgi:hypothetical protein